MNRALSATRSTRRWHARIDIELAQSGAKTVVAHSRHSGPLRLQRPFHPEADGTAHIYLLHPPGGMVLGDALDMNISARSGARGLITTPSAGRFYSVGTSAQQQRQSARLEVAEDAVLEWLPQETIVFSGAQARIETRLDVARGARFCAWDIVALGRAVGEQPFVSGHCEQQFEVLREGRPWFVERNVLQAGARLLQAPWGLNGADTVGTLVANVSLERDAREALLARVQAGYDPAHRFSLTQRADLLVGRYLGPSATQGRSGLAAIWAGLRSTLLGKDAAIPRIWYT